MSDFKFSGNQKIPTTISKLREFNAKANSATMNLGLGKPYEDTPPELRELAAELVKSSVLDYSENRGTLGLRTSIGQFFAQKPENFLITHGAQEALFSSIMGLLNAGDELLIPDPGFLAYKTMGELHGIVVTTYKLKKTNHQFTYDIDQLLRQVSANTKMVLISKVANPTGTDLSIDDLKKLALELKKRDVILLSDEVYGELHFKEIYDPLFKFSSNIVTVNSLSKSHALTGWRVGYVGTTHEEMMKKILVTHQYVGTCATRISQNLAEAIFANRTLYEKISNRYRIHYKEAVNEFLSILPGPAPSGAFYLFLPIPEKFSSDYEFCETLLKEQNILVIPGSIFGEAGKQYYRVALSVKDGVKEVALKFQTYYK